MSLCYSCHEPTGVVIVWEGSESFADLSHVTGTFDQRVERAKNICSALGGDNDLRATLPATRKQLNYLETLIYDTLDAPAMKEWERRSGKYLHELTREEASEWIGELSGRAA